MCEGQVKDSTDTLTAEPGTNNSLGCRRTEAALREVWRDIGECVSEKLERITIQNLCVRLNELSDGVPEYTI